MYLYLFPAVDFSTGENPWPIFKLQKEFNAPGRSPPLSTFVFLFFLSLFFFFFKHYVCSTEYINDFLLAYHFREFYTGWLTHWGETIATTDAVFTATYLEKILSKNGSAVLYVCNCTQSSLPVTNGFCSLDYTYF